MFLVNRRGLWVCRVPSHSLGLSGWARQCGVNGREMSIFLVTYFFIHYPLWLGPLCFGGGSFRCTLVLGGGQAPYYSY